MPMYVAILHKEPASDYGVSFPDFPGCVTAGSTLDEAQTMAQDALAVHAGFMQEQGQALPVAMTLDAAIRQAAKETLEGFFAAMMVPLEEGRSKAVRVNITVPERELHRIDSYAAAHGQSRSAFLVQAAQSAMTR